MEKILDGITVKAGENCFYSCLYNLAEYYAMELSETDIFFLCEGLTSEYQENLDTKSIQDRFQFLPYDEQAKNFARKMGCSIRVAHDRTKEENLEQIREAISEEHPIIVMVKPEILTYHPLDENIQNSCHCLYVYGINEKKGHAYIGDAYVVDSKGNVTVFNGRFPLEQLLEGMVGYAWFPDATKATVLDEGRKKANMLKQLSSFLDDSQDSNSNKGIQAWKACVVHYGNDELEADDYLAYIYLFQVRIPFIFKYLMTFLKNEQNSETKEDVILQLQNLEKQWNTFIITILMGSQAPSEKMEARIRDKGIRVIDDLENVLQNVKRHIQSNG